MSLVLLIPTDANEIQAWVSVAQLIFTMLSIGVIVATFNLQARTAKSQMEVQRMAMLNSRIQLRPIITIDVRSSWIGPDDPNGHVYPEQMQITFVASINKNHLTNLKLAINAGTIGEVFYDHFQITAINRERIYVDGEKIWFNCNFDWNIYPLPREDQRKYYFDFLMSYDDMLGTRYGQGIRFYPEATNQEFHPRIVPPRKD